MNVLDHLLVRFGPLLLILLVLLVAAAVAAGAGLVRARSGWPATAAPPEQPLTVRPVIPGQRVAAEHNQIV